MIFHVKGRLFVGDMWRICRCSPLQIRGSSDLHGSGKLQMLNTIFLIKGTVVRSCSKASKLLIWVKVIKSGVSTKQSSGNCKQSVNLSVLCKHALLLVKMTISLG